MSDLSDFEFDDLAQVPEEARSEARVRLFDAMERERRRVRRAGFALRALASGLVLFVAWSIAPAVPHEEQVPLVGLASAVAELPSPEIGPGQAWYVRANREDRIAMISSAGGEDVVVTVIVSTVEETWVRPDSRGVKRSKVSEVGFPTERDRSEFERLGLEKQLALDEAERVPGPPDYSEHDPMWDGGPEAIVAAVTRVVAPTSDVRSQRIEVLRSLTTLMQIRGSDPKRRSALLLAIDRIPGIQIGTDEAGITVSYRYVVNDVAEESRFTFDHASGQLVSEEVVTLATPTTPGTTLSTARYEAYPAALEALGS
jgi:hypothetical protein